MVLLKNKRVVLVWLGYLKLNAAIVFLKINCELITILFLPLRCIYFKIIIRF